MKTEGNVVYAEFGAVAKFNMTIKKAKRRFHRLKKDIREKGFKGGILKAKGKVKVKRRIK